MIIKEFLPNPLGADKDGEYIKIFNDGGNAVNLAGWKISDASNKAFNLSGTIKPNEELKLLYSQTKISLNNSGETVSLFNEKGELVDKLGYTGAAEEGKIVSHQKTSANETQLADGEILNKAFISSTGKIIATDIFVALILGFVAVYVILQLEKRLNTKLY